MFYDIAIRYLDDMGMGDKIFRDKYHLFYPLTK